jgi:subtilisin family serine protease
MKLSHQIGVYAAVALVVAALVPISFASGAATKKSGSRLSLVVQDSSGNRSASTAAHSATGASINAHRFVDGTVLLGFQPGTSAQEKRATVGSVDAIDAKAIGDGTHVLHVPRGKVLDKIDALKANPNVRYAEPDYVVHADGSSWSPDDQYFSKLWGMKTISASSAWADTMGSSSVVVGVVDTGVDYTHPDLAANVWSNPGVDGCPAASHGFNVLNSTCNPLDDNRHGTHVSGTIGAVGNNGIGVIGVSPTVRIMGLKFLDAGGSGSIANAVTAIDWAIKAKQAGVNVRVLSNSWGGGGYSQALADEINKAGANDILFIAAAGNNAANNDGSPVYPCNYHTANEICVAATDSHDGLASFSDYGAGSVDLAAPGVGILSTVPGGYASMSGTSMATPHVSGAAALALSAGYESVWTLKATILRAVDPLSSLSGLVATDGRLDVCKAIPACSGLPAIDPVPPPTVGDFSLSANGAKQMVSPGASTTFTVTATPSAGFMGQVDLTVSGLPGGAIASFSPDPFGVVSSPGSSTLTVTTGASTPRGTYTLTITGTSGSLRHSTNGELRTKS